MEERRLLDSYLMALTILDSYNGGSAVEENTPRVSPGRILRPPE
jgi:hypothetical protein